VTPDRDSELASRFVLDDSSGPARRIAPRQAASIIDAALAAIDERPAATPPRPRLRIIAIAATLAALTATAAAAIYFTTREPEPEPAPESAPAIPDPDPRAAEPPAPQPSPSEPVPVTVPEIVVDAPADDPPAPPRPSTSRREPAADLFARANALRAARRWRDADRLYAQIADAHPDTSTAQVALVASADLHLDHLRDPRGALTRYRSALSAAPRGALAEEARWGVAQAHRALGDRAAETQALADFLARHPDSPLAERARSRLAADRSGP
jgi:tetratricopeptide (TPR) repeat protein